MTVLVNSASSGIGGGSSGSVSGVTGLSTPASGYVFAVRASQASNGTLIDTSPTGATFQVNQGLIPVSWAPSSPVSVGNYRTPTVLNGLIYKVTTAGTTAASEPTWSTTIGGTTTSGTAVFTTEKGAWFTDTNGIRYFRSLSNTQTSQASFWQPTTLGTTWDLLQGQSLIVRARVKYDYNASGQGVLPILSNSLNGTGPGFRAIATGSSVQDLRIQIRGSGSQILSDDTSPGFARKPFDNTEREFVVLVDGQLKMQYCFIDNIPVAQGDMLNTTTGICPNNMNLSSISTTTLGTTWTIGGDPGNTTSTEMVFKAVDVIVRPAGLPANIQAISNWFFTRGDSLIPESLLQ